MPREKRARFMVKKNISFRRVVTPDNKCFYIPADIKLVFPKESLLPDSIRCLVYIPWERVGLYSFRREKERSRCTFKYEAVVSRAGLEQCIVCLHSRAQKERNR